MAKGQIIYIVRCNEFYKIGITDNIKKRMVALQTGNPYELSLVKTYRAVTTFEGEIHDMFVRQKVRGEWFQLDTASLEVIMEILEAYEASCVMRGVA
jgi:hypothetical protein